MATLMKRGNGERLVPDEKVAEFLEMGYSVIDSHGKVLVQAEPSTVPQFKALVNDLKRQIVSLNAKVQVLEAENSVLKASNSLCNPDEGEKPSNPASEENAAQNAEKPAKTARQKKAE